MGCRGATGRGLRYEDLRRARRHIAERRPSFPTDTPDVYAASATAKATRPVARSPLVVAAGRMTGEGEKAERDGTTGGSPVSRTARRNSEPSGSSVSAVASRYGTANSDRPATITYCNVAGTDWFRNHFWTMSKVVSGRSMRTRSALAHGRNPRCDVQGLCEAPFAGPHGRSRCEEAIRIRRKNDGQHRLGGRAGVVRPSRRSALPASSG